MNRDKIHHVFAHSSAIVKNICQNFRAHPSLRVKLYDSPLFGQSKANDGSNDQELNKALVHQLWSADATLLQEAVLTQVGPEPDT